MENENTNETKKIYMILILVCVLILTAFLIKQAIDKETAVKNFFVEEFRGYYDDVNAAKSNSVNNARPVDNTTPVNNTIPVDFVSLLRDNFNNDLLHVILSSTLLVIIPSAIIYYFGTLYNSRTVKRSKEDICIYGFHFFIVFVIIPLILFCIFSQIGLLGFVQYLLKTRFYSGSVNYFNKIALITITAQFFIVICLLYVYQDSRNILLSRLYKWPGIKRIAKILTDNVFKHLPKIKKVRENSEPNDRPENRCSPVQKCAEGRCLSYCLFFLFFSCTTIILTFFCILEVDILLKFILSIMSFFILSLIACCLPSIFIICDRVTVFLPGYQESLSGQLEMDTDELVRIYTKTGKRININKKMIGLIETSTDLSWKKMLLECVLFWSGVWVFIFLIIVAILILKTDSNIYAFICAFVISIIDLYPIVHWSDFEADYEESCSCI